MTMAEKEATMVGGPGRTGRGEKMRVLHVSVSDKENGAHLAGYRLHKGLLRLGVDSTMFVAHRLDSSGDDTILEYRRPEGILSKAKTFAYRRWITRDLSGYRKLPNGIPLVHDRVAEGLQPISQMPPADVIYIHSAQDFIDYFRGLPLLAQRAPVIRMLHDMNFFTGGCPYARGCERFIDCCGACPQLQSHNENDLSRRIWERKQAVFSRIRGRLHLVAPSQWIAQEANRSSLLRELPVEIIPYSVDTEMFRPQDRSAMRELWGIPKGAQVVGFLSHPLGRGDKGFPLLVKALETMKDAPDLYLITAGGGKPPVDARIPHLHLGRIYDSHSLCAFYSAADVVAIPSLEDNLPSVAMEAMACGTPAVAFATGGIPEMVRHEVTGLVVPKADTEALREGIAELLQDSPARARMAENGRRVAVEEYSLRVQAKRHADLCARITSCSTVMKSRCVPEPHSMVRHA
jgi:glycosyltransferase involved in cell wall biosynthesis